ncbi:MAG TPA: 2Fe-2S iron-sulfur cluster-binding protein, partial [Spirochaetales bacterium]|nr:2Fe-2S iron-sulfur cluster-binding protein [Spirochaetales bacterium]
MSAARTVRFHVDGRSAEAPEGSNLLEALRAAGSEVPSLCWHSRLTPTGACRLCVVKIEGRRGLVTSCSTPVEEGMKVTAFDGELEEARRWILSLLAEEVETGSDGSHRDELEELLLRYGVERPAKLRPSRGAARPPDRSSHVLAFDASRCIKCFRCVKAGLEVQGKGVLSLDGR